jgi:general secretion pathway protein M
MKTFNWSALSFKSIKSINSINSIKSLALSYFMNLKQRERLAISIAGGVIVIFLVLQLLLFPILDRRTRLRKEIVDKTEALQQIHDMRAEYQSLSRNTSTMEERLKRRPGTFTLFTYIDRLAGKNQLKGNIAYMKPSTTNIKNSPLRLSTVEMKLNGLTMEQLTAFLHGIENKNNAMWLRRITLSKGDQAKDLLDVVLQVETFQK